MRTPEDVQAEIDYLQDVKRSLECEYDRIYNAEIDSLKLIDSLQERITQEEARIENFRIEQRYLRRHIDDIENQIDQMAEYFDGVEPDDDFDEAQEWEPIEREPWASMAAEAEDEFEREYYDED